MSSAATSPSYTDLPLKLLKCKCGKGKSRDTRHSDKLQEICFEVRLYNLAEIDYQYEKEAERLRNTIPGLQDCRRYIEADL